MFAGFEKAVVAHAGREEAAEFPRLRRVVGPVASLVDRAGRGEGRDARLTPRVSSGGRP
jgi:hypothetical protein